MRKPSTSLSVTTERGSGISCKPRVPSFLSGDTRRRRVLATLSDEIVAFSGNALQMAKWWFGQLVIIPPQSFWLTEHRFKKV